MSRHSATSSPTARGWVGQVIAWFVITSVVALLAACVLVPRIAGATPFTVLTSSMEPLLPPGTLVVIKPVDVDEVGVGSVITYQLESGEPTVVTHRVVAKGITATGEPVITTQGDANETPDSEPVHPVQIRGELWYAIPHVGRLNSAISGSQRDTALMLVVTGLLGYAGYMFVGATRDRRRHTSSIPAPTHEKEDITT